MKKVNYLLLAAGVFISGVMIYLIFSGVSLKEREMIKWSHVENFNEAGVRVAQFMFPILSEYPLIVINDQSLKAQEFYTAYLSEAKINNPKTVVLNQWRKENKVFDLQVIDLKNLELHDLCQKGKKLYCIGLKAQKSFQKKPRESQYLWINLYRVSQNQAVFYFN